MLGIQQIEYYIPEKRIDNYSLKAKYGIDDNFIDNKIGIKSVSRKDIIQKASDLGTIAVQKLLDTKIIDKEDIEVLIVVTQNPDYNIPHTSAIIHANLDLSEDVASFDISLGCSGFVYGLSVIKSFMIENNFKKGVLVTSDPYSDILNEEDKNTSLLFGDAASAILISDEPVLSSGKYSFGTIGKRYESLINSDKLFMNGRDIFNFAAKYVPKDFNKVIKLNQIEKDNVDYFLFHQGSKLIIDTLTKMIKIPKEKVIYDIYEYGNTVSSSIPIILSKMMNEDYQFSNIFISGFGVGLSWSSTILKRV